MRRRMFARGTVVVALLFAGAVFSAVFFQSNRDGAAVRDREATAEGTGSAALRTVLVVTEGDPLSESATQLTVRFVKGVMPTHVMETEVLTDESCEPDAQGISHCINTMRLETGEKLTVVHNHPMHTVACPYPGETVRISPS